MKSILKIKKIELSEKDIVILNGEICTVDQLGSAMLAYKKQLERNKLRRRKKMQDEE